MKTVAKNRTVAIEAIFASVTGCQVHSEDTYFAGRDCDAKWAQEALNRYSFAKLVDYGNGKYHVNVHSNLWYEMRTTPA